MSDVRTMKVTGRLGADSELKTTKNDAKYYQLRLANHAFGDADGETTWMTVTVWQAAGRCYNLASKLKKGSFVMVEGDVFLRIYKNKKTNEPEMGIDIHATSIYPLGDGRKRDENDTANEASSSTTPEQTDAPTPATPTPKTTTPTPPSINVQADEDLPF